MSTARGIIIAFVLTLTSASCSILLKHNEDTKPLSSTTVELLSSFEHCIVFIFDWANENDYELTSSSYFTFYSESINCALVVETYYDHRNRSVVNSRFTGPYEPHPLFTKHIRTLTNLYSAAVTAFNAACGRPATDNISAVLKKYNIAFNYVLLFASSDRFSPADNMATFSKCTQVSAPAVYLVILDEHEVYVIGFAQVLQSAPYLFRLFDMQETHIQHLHESIHEDLQQALVIVGSYYHPRMCKFGTLFSRYANTCAFSALIEAFNMTYCNVYYSSCKSARITSMYTGSKLKLDELFTRRDHINFEFLNYLLTNDEFSFICMVETDLLGFMAFVQAFDFSTWIVTVSACLFLTVAIAAMSNGNDSNMSFWTKLLSSGVLVVMLIMERFYTNAQLERAASRQTMLVITLWAFGAMLLGMSYSGNMVSELASPSLPSLPQDMHELSLVRYPIFTATESSVLIDGKIFKQGFLHGEIKEYFVQTVDRKGSLEDDLRRLSVAVTFVNNSGSQPTVKSENRKSSRVSFASAASSETVKANGLRNVMNHSRLVASNARNLPFFNNQYSFVAETNSVLPAFRKFLARLCAPGFWKYWHDIREHVDLKDLIHNGYAVHEVTFGRIWVNRISLAAIWHDFGHLMDGSASVSPIDVDNLKPAFQLLGTSLLVSVFALFYERWPLHGFLRLIPRWAANVLVRLGAILHAYAKQLGNRRMLQLTLRRPTH